MCADVALEVEGVVEAFPAEAAQMPLGLVVALDVSVEHALVMEGLLTNLHEAKPRSVSRRFRETRNKTSETDANE